MLGYLLLYRWAKEERRIVVIKPAMPVLLLCPTGAYELDEFEMRHEMERDDVRYAYQQHIPVSPSS